MNTSIATLITAAAQAARVVTLRDAQGRTRTGVAGPGMKNLAQVSVGDRVRTQYSREPNVSTFAQTLSMVGVTPAAKK